jgi:hypothetical protein
MRRTSAKTLIYAGWLLTAGLALWGGSMWIGPYQVQDGVALWSGTTYFVLFLGALAVVWSHAAHRSRTKSTRRHCWTAAIFAGLSALLLFVAAHWWDYQQTLASERRARELSAPPRDDARNTIRPETE